MDAAGPYPLHLGRWILRSVACGPLILSFSLYIADGVACVKSINAINYGDVGYGFTEDPVGSCWIDPAYGDLRPVLIAVAAMIWNIAEFVTLCVNRRGIHPGAHIALDLLLSWALLASAGISFYAVATFFAGASIGKYTAAAVFATLAAMLHFTLFILNAVAVHQWRHAMFPYGSYNGQAPPTSIVYQQPGGPYASLPPPPPGMAYLVPVNAVAVSHSVDMHTAPLPRNGGGESEQPEVSVPNAVAVSHSVDMHTAPLPRNGGGESEQPEVSVPGPS